MQSSIYSEARLYDILFGDTISDEQLAFYEQLIQEYGEPVLELACGSGKFTIPLARKGYRLTGLDLSPEMLALAESKSDDLPIDYKLGDIRAFSLAKKYPFIFIAAQSFQHLLTKKDIETCLACVSKHLKRNGVFLIQVFNPAPAILAKSPNEKIPTHQKYYVDKLNGETYQAFMNIRYDSSQQLLHSTYCYHSDLNPMERTFELTLRQFFPKELDALVEYNGFDIVAKYGDLAGTPFDEKPAYQHLLLRKRR